MAITSSSNPAFIEATQYSTFILQNLHDGLLPNTLYRNVTDFPNGTTLNIKTIGSATIQEITEDEDITYNPIESGNIQLSISDYIGDGFYVTDIMRQDGAQVEQLLSMRASEGTRAIQETFESRFLATLDASQVQGGSNDINGFAHRSIASGGTNQVMTEADLIDMRLAYDQANVPLNGRIAIVAATFSKTIQLTSNTGGIGASGELFQQLVKDGFDKDHKFVTDIHGWQIWTSNRLPTCGAGFDVDGNTITRAGVANIFMCVADDQCKPGMVAWRQTPTTETDRDISKGRDEFVTKTRWGDGVQRQDSLGVIYCDSALTVAN